MAVVELEDGNVAWSKGFGLADRERSIPATPDTPFQLASVTKALAAVATLRLEERGALKLSERSFSWRRSRLPWVCRERRLIPSTWD